MWAEVTALAQSPGVLDLGQGWPDFGASEVARRAAADAIVDSPDPSANQYSVVPGRPELRSAIERYYRSTGTREPGEVLVTTSATEAIYVAIQALCDPGDEIVFLEPFFPWYISHVRAHGGVPIAVPMARSPDADDGGFRLDLDALRAAFGPKTKAFLYNSPHKPTGAVFTPEEIAAVASLCAERDVVCVADEVYERCVFGDASVARMADAPGMRERTLTIGTSSKLLCLSGWRVGWIVGPPALVAAIRSLHSYTTYCAPTPLQLGVAAALESIADEADAATRERARDASSRAAEEGGERARRDAAAKATRGSSRRMTRRGEWAQTRRRSAPRSGTRVSWCVRRGGVLSGRGRLAARTHVGGVLSAPGEGGEGGGGAPRRLLRRRRKGFPKRLARSHGCANGGDDRGVRRGDSRASRARGLMNSRRTIENAAERMTPRDHRCTRRRGRLQTSAFSQDTPGRARSLKTNRTQVSTILL